MKKALSIVMSVILTFVMCIPSFATKLTTEVPYEHTVTINYNEGGTVLLEGRVCPNGAQVKINRFGEIDLSTILENGHHLQKVTINGVDVTSYYKDGNIKITNITEDVYVNFTFEKCTEDPDDNCGSISMTGTVYLGDKELSGAEMSFDFGSVVASTNKDGKYYVEQISEGRHIVTISKNGEVLAHITFVIEFADVDKIALRTAVDGTQVVVVPYGTDLIYLDFYIIDSDGDGIPDQNPEITDPNNPNIDPDEPNNPDCPPIIGPEGDNDNDGIPDYNDPDDDNDGIPDGEDPDADGDGYHDDYDGSEEGDLDNDGGVIDIDKPGQIIPDVDIPNTSAEYVINCGSFMFVIGIIFFFIIFILFKQKKDEKEDEIIEIID